MRPLTLVFCAGAFFVNLARAYSDNLPFVNIDPSTQVVPPPAGPGQFPGFNEAHGDGVVGWGFQLERPVTVNQVGWYDDGQDGLTRSFEVGLWQGYPTSQNNYFLPQLLGDPTFGIYIPAGTTAALENSWRVIDLATPLELQPGFYTLGGMDTATTADPIKYLQLPSGSTFAPPTALTGYNAEIGWFFYSRSGGDVPFFTAPHDFYPLDGLELGPMLFISVPEPSSLALLVIAFAGLLVFYRHLDYSGKRINLRAERICRAKPGPKSAHRSLQVTRIEFGGNSQAKSIASKPAERRRVVPSVWYNLLHERGCYQSAVER